MTYRTRILLINNQNQINKNVQEILSTLPNTSLRTTPTFRKASKLINQTHTDLILICSDLGKKKTLAFCENIRNTKPTKTEILILTNENTLEHLLPYLHHGANYISTIPINKTHLSLLIQQSCSLIQTNSSKPLTHGNIHLYSKQKYLKYKNSKIFITETEALIIKYILTEKRNCKTEDIRKYISSKRGHTSQEYIQTNMGRLRKKIRDQFGLDLIKNKYRDGYYITI